ncbi:PIN domain-containing protein [Rhodobacter sp. Har01]|uniref:PIN domain-containing protein n=1 Tax=Rhodobacter sp. Har01 TaxID=2883999 RepID=UPI001D084FE2|nr:PIN domain-containing protein [Rhodobacter sp. Har01]MCB6178477.1 PIN domain-containing protein [Rhodobacter sp. Har01]
MSHALFLDANVFLSFYAFGKDDLEEMAKVVKLIGDEEITLHTNTHLESEIRRNREGKIGEAFSSIKSLSFSREYPHYFNDYPELGQIRTKLKEVSLLHSKLVDQARKDIESRSLRADHLIEGLLKLGTRDDVSNLEVEAALRRCDLGEPPGKKGSIGDAIHWLSLLKKPVHAISIVSLDSDFSNPLDPLKINPFLGDEWKRVKKFGQPHLYRSLSDYFKAQFPKITLSDEFEKDELVKKLVQSANFSETHQIIERLTPFSSFTKAQVRGLFNALLQNTQVGWIATDPDVKDFYLTLRGQAVHLDGRELRAASELLEVHEDYFDIPF